MLGASRERIPIRPRSPELDLPEGRSGQRMKPRRESHDTTQPCMGCLSNKQGFNAGGKAKFRLNVCAAGLQSPIEGGGRDSNGTSLVHRLFCENVKAGSAALVFGGNTVCTLKR